MLHTLRQIHILMCSDTHTLMHTHTYLPTYIINIHIIRQQEAPHSMFLISRGWSQAQKIEDAETRNQAYVLSHTHAHTHTHTHTHTDIHAPIHSPIYIYTLSAEELHTVYSCEEGATVNRAKTQKHTHTHTHTHTYSLSYIHTFTHSLTHIHIINRGATHCLFLRGGCQVQQSEDTEMKNGQSSESSTEGEYTESKGTYSESKGTYSESTAGYSEGRDVDQDKTREELLRVALKVWMYV
jgi:hypothetical protein